MNRQKRIDASLAKRRQHRDQIVLDPEATARLARAREALGLTENDSLENNA